MFLYFTKLCHYKTNELMKNYGITEILLIIITCKITRPPKELYIEEKV